MNTNKDSQTTEKNNKYNSKEIQYIYDKLNSFEEQLLTMKNDYNNETQARNDYEGKMEITTNELRNEIKNIKQNAKVYELKLSKSINNYDSLNKEVNIKNDELYKLIMNNQKDFSDQLNEKQKDDLKDLFLFTNTNISNISNNSCNEKINIKNEFVNYRTELSSALIKMNFMEKTFNNKIEHLNDEISNIKKEIIFIKKNIINITNTIKEDENNSINICKINENKFNNINKTLNQFLNTGINQQNEKFNELNYQIDFSKNSSQKNFEDINEYIKNISKDFNYKFKLLQDNLFQQINNLNHNFKEFKSQITLQHDNFNKYQKENMEENISRMKSIFEYTNNDVDILRTQNNYMQNNFNKLRSDLYNTVNDTEKFVLNKLNNKY